MVYLLASRTVAYLCGVFVGVSLGLFVWLFFWGGVVLLFGFCFGWFQFILRPFM